LVLQIFIIITNFCGENRQLFISANNYLQPKNPSHLAKERKTHLRVAFFMVFNSKTAQGLTDG